VKGVIDKGKNVLSGEQNDAAAAMCKNFAREVFAHAMFDI